MSRKNKFFIFIFCLFSLSLVVNFLVVSHVGAQNFGTNAVANGLNNSLSSADPRFIIGRIIQIALGLLGVIAVVLVIYAGFLWMTSGGDEDKIGQAKRILRNATIGLVIILMSWAVVTFFISRLYEAIGTGNANFDSGKTLSDQGLGASGACTIDSFYPANSQKEVARNSSIIITFKEEIKLDSVCTNEQGNVCVCDTSTCNRLNNQAIRLYQTDLGDACDSSCPNPNTNVTDLLVTVPAGNKTLVITPRSLLGSPNKNTNYSIKFSNQVKKLDSTSMFKTCSADYFSWGFQVNTNLDLIPPQVVLGGIFPLPDNEKDVFRQITPAQAAQSKINVLDCPKVFAAATVQDISPSGPTVTLNYHGSISKFKVVVPAEAPNKAQLFNGLDNSLLGVADFGTNGLAVFPNYFSFSAPTYSPGDIWVIDIVPEQLADNLVVGSQVYLFATSNENNNIAVPPVCDNNIQAANIQAKLSGHPDIDVDLNNNQVSLTAKVAGESGNDLLLSTTNIGALALTPFNGGTAFEESNESKDKKDRPMNSVIQVNFNEALNPVTVSGTADEVKDYIRVVNAIASSSPAGAVCSNNSDCRSYKCDSGVCVGDYLGGKFMVANGYKTIEFISNDECGVNGCGEKIYCLPANSHLSVELVTANLKTCSSDSDCLSYSPFKSCLNTALGYKTCQNSDNKNYPMADLGKLDGLVDAAINSFDGDRDTYADGPIDYYDDNYEPIQNVDKKDKYKWSFYINDKIALDPPQIVSIEPNQGQEDVNLLKPVQVTFNTLMMNSTLRTGSTLVYNGSSTFEHKLVNLRSASPTPLGYWILCDNQDIAPADGEPDTTVAKIFHSEFLESVTYRAQVGSGVKDIYQNCYKPSVGPNCQASQDKPSCCFGSATSTLNPQGDCQ